MSLAKIKIIQLKIFENNKGDILKYINKKDKYFKKFGEIYFTEIKKNSTKGWNFHKKNQCLITVPFGKVKFTFTKRMNSKKKIIIIGKKNYSIIVVPPGNWFKFESLEKFSLVASTLDNIHSDEETLKLPIK
jgi:dTDP-4-dehydrorhamnose 3,5-epimerase-like enzyme